MRLYCMLLMMAMLIITACKKEDKEPVVEDPPTETKEPELIFKVKIDGNQQRLNNLGQPSEIPEGHAAQTPSFNAIAAHYIELSSSAFVQVGEGEVVYHAPETSVGGEKAVDFEQTKLVNDGEIIFKMPLKDVQTGSYEYARVSVVYQNYDIDFRAQGFDLKATLASFVGFNTYITSYKINQMEDVVNANKSQGYWAWETHPNEFMEEPLVQTGQAPGTTVPNPISGTSPIPPGSCLVTGKFDENLVILGDETSDIVVELSFSVNDSFEWEDNNGNNIYEPQEEEKVVDMGLRGLIPRVVK